MLKKENRLSTTFEYNVAKKYGTHTESRYFHLYKVKPTNYTGPAKVGIVVSTNLHKNAVQRNRVKRLIREAVRQNFARLEKDTWVAVYPKHSILNATYENISSEINKAL